jgi:hypothetical protein
MQTLEIGRKIHGDDAKLKKGLKRHGWVMGLEEDRTKEHGKWVNGPKT